MTVSSSLLHKSAHTTFAHCAGYERGSAGTARAANSVGKPATRRATSCCDARCVHRTTGLRPHIPPLSGAQHPGGAEVSAGPLPALDAPLCFAVLDMDMSVCV